MAQRARIFGDWHKNYDLYLLSLPAFVYFVLFHYVPIYGVQIAFKDFSAALGITGSPWVGMEHFARFFRSFYFTSLIKNTIGISLYSLAVGFPVPIILALLLNEVGRQGFKKSVQMATYAPHFISTVVMAGMLANFLAPDTGLVNILIKTLGGQPLSFLSKPEYFKTIYVVSGVWQEAGWASIIYIAALSGIDPQLHEAAIIDGANKVQRIRHINIPGILPTAVIMLILNMGRIMNVGFEKIFLLQNPLNMSASDVISTFVYRTGVLNGEYGFSAAVGLFNSLINCTLLVLVNSFAKRMGQTSLW